MNTALKLINIIEKDGLARSPSLSEDAALQLREMILLGQLPPGTQLPERDLAQALGVSRTPMREAIRLLANEGLVSYTHSRRPFVADPSLAEINDCLRVQGALEALAGQWACAQASDSEIDAIEQLNASIKEARGAEEQLQAFRLDMQFHQAIVAAARNKALAETHTTYNARLWRVRFLSSQREEGRPETRMEHSKIIDALQARDPRATAEALQNHLRTAEKNVAAALAELSSRSDEASE